MSWTPRMVRVTRWVLRCDGALTRGQCEQLAQTDPYDEPQRSETRLWAEPILGAGDEQGLRWDGWLVLRDGRVLCPAHVAAGEYQVRAALDGLPFPDTHPHTETDANVDAGPGPAARGGPGGGSDQGAGS